MVVRVGAGTGEGGVYSELEGGIVSVRLGEMILRLF
jgi:hypothetical protein